MQPQGLLVHGEELGGLVEGQGEAVRERSDEGVRDLVGILAHGFLIARTAVRITLNSSSLENSDSWSQGTAARPMRRV